MVSDHDQKILEDYEKFRQKQSGAFSVDEARAGFAEWLESQAYNLPRIGSYEQGIEIRDGLRCDIAVPDGSGPFPVILYLHGGAWMVGSAATYRKLAMQLAELGYLVFNLDYRLAPEHQYPAALDDSIFAARWAFENAHRWNGDPERMVTAGDSVGANLSVGTMLASAGQQGPRIGAGILLYGLFDMPAALERNPATTEYLLKNYLAGNYPALVKSTSVSPVYGVAPGKLPPCLVVVGGADAEFIPQAEAMVNALADADVKHRLKIFEGMPHGFLNMGELAASRACFQEIRKFIDQYV